MTSAVAAEGAARAEAEDSAPHQQKNKRVGAAIVVDCTGDTEEEDSAAPPETGRRSKRLASQGARDASEHVLTYPALGAKSSISLLAGDVARLRPEPKSQVVNPEALQFNDSLVDFWLMYVQHVILKGNPRLQERCHFLNAFFYKHLRRLHNENLKNRRLSSATGRGRQLLTEALARKHWAEALSKVFRSDYVHVPVHEERMGGHWTLAIMCFPALAVTRAVETGVLVPDKMPAFIVEESKRQERELAEANGVASPCILFLDSAVEHCKKALFPTLRAFLAEGYLRLDPGARCVDIAAGPEEAPTAAPAEESRAPTPAPAADRTPPEPPSRQRRGRRRMAAKARRDKARSPTSWLSGRTMPQHVCRHVPQQDNSYDCGTGTVRGRAPVAVCPLKRRVARQVASWSTLSSCSPQIRRRTFRHRYGAIWPVAQRSGTVELTYHAPAALQGRSGRHAQPGVVQGGGHRAQAPDDG